MPARAQQGHHLALLICILVLFALSPLITVLEHGALLLNVIAATAVVAASYTLIRRKQLFIIALGLCALSIVATALLLRFPETWSLVFSHAAIMVMLAFFCVTILDYVLRPGRITSDKIYAAICVYLLIGYAWTFAYALLESIQPGAFGGSGAAAPQNFVARILELRYLSFVTLTTVGFGDIVPISSGARTLCLLEAIMGQIYLTVLVARLVGLHIAHHLDDRAREAK